jgi:hypothetical protein
MSRVGAAFLVAVIGLSVIALHSGDPRATSGLPGALRVDLDALVVTTLVAVIAWWTLARRRRWWTAPVVIIAAISGALCGWIAACEFLGQPTQPAHGFRAGAFLVGLTAAGTILCAAPLAWLCGFTRRGRAET